MRRRVLVLNHFAAPVDAAGGTRHVELFSLLRDWEALVIASNRNYLTRQVADHHDDLYRTVWSSPYSDNGPSRVLNWASFAVTAFAAGLRWGRADVVYASSPHLLTGLSGWALARLRRSRFVLEVRDLWPRILVDMGQLQTTSTLYAGLCRLAGFLYRRADVVVVMAKGVQRQLIEEEGVEPSRIQLIPNGATPEDFVPSKTREQIRVQFGLERFVVAYAGAHGPANGLDFVLDAARELRTEMPEVHFLLVGDGLAKQTLVERARNEGLVNVEFRPPIPKSEIRVLLAGVDAGLHVLADVPLFRYGVSPNKLFDYMAAGLPVITNTRGEVRELVEEAQAGLAVEAGAIASAVRALVAAGPEKRAAWGEAGRAFIVANHSRSELGGRLEATLDGLVPSDTQRVGR